MSLLDRWDGKLAKAVVLTPGEGMYVERLRQLGHSVTVIPQPQRLGRYGGAVYEDGYIGKIRNGVEGLRYIRSLRRELKQSGIAAVFCNDMRGLLTVGAAARSLRIPVMIWDKLDKPHGRLDLFELPLVTRVAIISNSVLSKFPRWQVERFRNKIKLVPNGADLTKFDVAVADRDAFGITPEDLAIGMVGTVCHRKAQDRVLEIMPDLLKHVPNAVLVIAGSWEDCDQDQQYFDGLPMRDHPRVRFLGQIDNVPTLMKSIDLFVIPSRYEGMGQVTVEAMACGLPVVGSDAGGIPEVVVAEQTGLIFDGDDRQTLIKSLVRLGRDAALRDAMGQRGRARVEQYYDRPVQMKKICKLLTDLMPRAVDGASLSVNEEGPR